MGQRKDGPPVGSANPRRNSRRRGKAPVSILGNNVIVTVELQRRARINGRNHRSGGIDRHAYRSRYIRTDPGSEPGRYVVDTVSKRRGRLYGVYPGRRGGHRCIGGRIENPVAIEVNLDKPALVHGHIHPGRGDIRYVIVVKRPRIAACLEVHRNDSQVSLESQRAADVVDAVQQDVPGRIGNACATAYGQLVVLVGEEGGESDRGRSGCIIESYTDRSGQSGYIIAIAEDPIAAAGGQCVVRRIGHRCGVHSSQIVAGHQNRIALDRRPARDPRWTVRLNSCSDDPVVTVPTEIRDCSAYTVVESPVADQISLASGKPLIHSVLYLILAAYDIPYS